jgi:hypothetical protein
MSMSNDAVNIVEVHDFDPADLGEPLGIERRIDGRKVISIRATVTVPGEGVLQGHTVDLSRGGAAITMPFSLAPGQDCLIDLELEACGMVSAFHIPAQVCYCVPLDGARFRAGVQFGQTDDTTTALIAAVLK